MFYYVILVNLVNVTFNIFKFPAVPSPYVLTSQGTEPGRQMLASAGEDIARDTTGGTSREHRTR
ncbi:unnamed protein product [Staurois parvus]|uniref:Uncharacterized protein n=1 Tax=Staurois parvus TaxID=386267 RepID=A0ABN9A6H9_9NEOB|nr:unnamed protein product [Staurois parvus]